MTKEDLRAKYERIHFEESDNKKGKLKQGYAKWLENELIEAINYSLCCTELKVGKSTLTFKDWLKENGYYKKGFEWFNKHGYSRDFDKLKKYYELSDCL